MGPSATSQLLALLVAAGPRMQHADEAEMSTSDDDDNGAVSSQPSVSSQPTRRKTGGSPDVTPLRKRAAVTSHTISQLSPEQRASATDATALPKVAHGLFEMGADANSRDADGNSPLYLALHVVSVRAALSLVHELLRRGADPNTRRHGATVLHHALRLGRAPLAQRLLREGAFPHRTGETAPVPAAMHLATVAKKHGFHDEALTHMRRGLRAAAARGDLRAVRGLLMHGCPPDNQLVYALVRKRREPAIVQALLRGGADPNASDDLGTRLLTLAVLQSDAGFARMLLEAGADPLAEEDGQTILELAKKHGATAEVLELMANRARAP